MVVDSEILHSKLKEFFGYDFFKGDQEAVIASLVEGNDVFVLMPTGAGKSLCYQLPALVMEGTAVVISPLIALMKNQVDVIRSFARAEKSDEAASGPDERVAHFLNSSLKMQEIEAVREDLMSGVTKLLYVAPESLSKAENIALLKDIKISFYAIDEAHCISEWGHDFRIEYSRLRQYINEIGPAPVIALTATATPKVQMDIMKNLQIPDAKVFKSSFNRPGLYYEIRDKSDPRKEIVRYIKQNPGQSGIIYCLSRKKVEEIAHLLQINGIKALPYHAGMEAQERAANQDKFLMEDIDVIVATIAFGMGIDKPDVRFVIHYDIPKSIEGYFQETGRAGRDGLGAKCIAYYSYKDIQKLEKFMQGKPVSEQEIGRQLLSETVAYAESNQCRRKLLLNYFGEQYTEDNCGCCDNCLNPKEVFDGREEMSLVIELIESLPEKFKTDHLAAILAGHMDSLMKSYRHDKIEFYGAGKEHDVRFWLAVIRQGIILHLLDKDIEMYGLISVTDAGREFLASPYALSLTKAREFVEGDDDDDDDSPARQAPGSGESGDPVLLAMLKDLRKDMSRKLGLQSWIIFNDNSLEDMAIFYPITFDELKKCQGVGEGKARKYGGEFIKLIAKYVDENEIARPDDFVMKSAETKSAHKVAIIKAVDRKMDIEDIASERGMELEELISEMESIVYSGTRLNLNYIIDDRVDEDDVADVYDYLKEASSDVMSKVMNEFPDLEENDLRLIRLKFISEVAN